MAVEFVHNLPCRNKLNLLRLNVVIKLIRFVALDFLASC